MAIDNANKRFSMINMASPIISPLFIPDSTVDDGDRYHLLNLYFGITLSATVEIWQEVTGNAATWFCQNPTETTWDTNSTFWDLDGNVYKTLWDNIDDTWSDASTNSPTWTDV